MACFIVTATEAVVVTALEKAEEKKEIKAADHGLEVSETKVPMSRKLKWLTHLLWGGVVLLAFEHVWHGEVAPWFPFLTAMSSAQDTAEMLHEMATVGVCMAALITIVWIGMCVVADVIVKRPSTKESNETV